MKSFALGTNGKVTMWCRQRGRTLPDGAIKFEVLNGWWNGTFKDGVVKIAGGADKHVDLLWEGDAPFDKGNYTSAIIWIGEQIAAGVTKSPQLEPVSTSNTSFLVANLAFTGSFAATMQNNYSITFFNKIAIRPNLDIEILDPNIDITEASKHFWNGIALCMKKPLPFPEVKP